MPEHSVLTIANEIKRRCFSEKRSLAHMKLQKLVYISHGWTLAITGHALFSERVEAWDNGPVAPFLYREERYGHTDIQGQFPDTAKTQLTPPEKNILDAVWKRYGDYSAEQLSDMTHEPNTPWSITYLQKGRNAQISNDLIMQHYRNLGRAGRNR